MVNLKIDKESHYKNTKLKQKEKDTIVFYSDTWNDFGYQVAFDAYYYDEDLEEFSIGRYKIFEIDKGNEETVDWDNLVLKNKTVDSLSEDGELKFEPEDNYFSIAAEESFYDNLRKYAENDYEDVLNKLRDITNILVESDIRLILESEKDVYRNVILREFSSNSRNILENRGFYLALEKIEHSLNGENYSEKKNLSKILNSNLRDTVFKYVNCFDYEDFEKLVEIYLSVEEQKDEKYRSIKELIEKAEKNRGKDYSKLLSELEKTVDKNLEKILQAVNKIQKLLKYKVDGTDVKDFVHYTGISTLKFLIKKPETGSENKKISPLLRLGNARQMNDPKEGQTFYDLINLKLEDTEVTDDYSPSSFYFASMAGLTKDNEIDDNLQMWKMYGGDSRGLCLTYSNDYIKKIINNGNEIYKVVYKNKIQDEIKSELAEIENALANIKEDKTKLQQALSSTESIRYLFKESDYSYENEYRILVNYEGKEEKLVVENVAELPRAYAYIDTDFIKYSKVKIGPNAKSIDFIAPYIKYVDNNIKVTQSKIPYRTDD